jgi:aminomethyltransferase
MSVPAPEAPLTAAFRERGVPLMEATPGLWVPLRFGDSAGEQRATRGAAGLYDFSFMALFEIAGRDAPAFLNRVQSRDANRLLPGHIAYTLLLNENGSVFIDATLWCVGDGRYWLMSGRRSDRARVEAVAAGFDVALRDFSGSHAVIAVQGPSSAQLLRRCGAGALPAFFRYDDVRLGGHECRVARLGYTGELGYEIFVDASAGARLWQDLREAGEELGVQECGFEAADGLRIECGFILFSRELALPVWPREVGLQRLVERRARAGGERPQTAKRLVGLYPQRGEFSAPALLPAAAPAPGFGLLTSTAYSDLFRRPLALGYVAAEDSHPGTRVSLAGGGSAWVARLPFYDPPKRRPRVEV